VQTYGPHESCIQFARRAELEEFLEEELAMRKELNYPPYRHLIRHVFRGRSEEKTRFYAEQWRKALDDVKLPNIEIKGPIPTPLEKMRGYYRYHLFYLTRSVSSSLPLLQKNRLTFPLDKEVFDFLDIDAHQLS